jgi:septum formation protein
VIYGSFFPHYSELRETLWTDLDVTANDHSARAGHFWQCAQPLILASKSWGRRLVLQQTGIPFVATPAELDEREIEREIRTKDGGADEVARALARAKALKISVTAPEAYVLGADQVASCEGRLFGKPDDLAQAAQQLAFLSGRSHRLHSAVALARGGSIVFETVCHADLRMRELSASFIDAYLGIAGDGALASAGAYQIEGMGVHLFSEVSGDHWTILGLPILPVLNALRRESALAG